MSTFDDYYYLGNIINPHGFKGKLNVYLDTDEPAAYDQLDALFLNIKGGLVPYFIESIKIRNQKAVLELQDVDTLEKASLLSKTEMYLPLSTLPTLEGNQFYYHEVVGFEIIDKEYGSLGAIKEVLEYPNQAVLQVFTKEKEVLIPINSGIIQKVDRSHKTIHIQAPDGLISMYLNA